MADLNIMLHDVCEYESLTMTHLFSFKLASFQFQLGMDQNGYIYQIFSPPTRSFKSKVNSQHLGRGQHMIDSYQSSVMTDFSARLIGALGSEIARHDSNLEVAEWLKGELKRYLFRQRGVVGTVTYHWKNRKK